MKKFQLYFFMLYGAVFLSLGCSPDTQVSPIKNEFLNLPQQTANYSEQEVPEHFKNTFFSGSQITDDGATLGRVLFYDKKLSLNNQIACASCHFQSNAFSDPSQYSTGFEGRKTSRNSPSIFNTSFKSRFFWDHRASSLKMQVMMPIQNHIEMGMENLENLVKKFQNTAYYPPLFKTAYGSETITTNKISGALVEFLQSILSCKSKWDEGKINGFKNFTAMEIKGKQLFEKSGCDNCHGGTNFSGYNDVANIGLDMEYTDRGRLDAPNLKDEFSFRNEDPDIQNFINRFYNGAFATPSLRNVILTAPYMHDGRFKTLNEVLEHYSTGVKPHPGLHYFLWGNLKEAEELSGRKNDIEVFLNFKPEPLRLNLSITEKNAIIAYLNTLTDESFINDPKFSDPFVKR